VALHSQPDTSRWSIGQLAQVACVLEATACKPGNVHRFRDFDDLHFVDFLLSATAIAGPLDRAVELGVGATVLAAVEGTRRVVSTNTNLGMILLLAPLAAVPRKVDLAEGVARVLAATTLDDARQVFRAILLAAPGGLGHTSVQDVRSEPTVTLREAMSLAAGRDLIARQYANGFDEVLLEGVPVLRAALEHGQPLETGIITTFLYLLARHHDSLIVRKRGTETAREVTRRAAAVLAAGWPDRLEGRARCDEFDSWLRDEANRLNPGTTADLVTAALFAALRDGTIPLPRTAGPAGWSRLPVERLNEAQQTP
jgi:triphosphoribosyl-dephospho-CoA synthase